MLWEHPETQQASALLPFPALFFFFFLWKTPVKQSLGNARLGRAARACPQPRPPAAACRRGAEIKEKKTFFPLPFTEKIKNK